jgi:hypothetical protein
MFVRAVNLVTHLNELINELKCYNNPEYREMRTKLDAVVESIETLEFNGIKPPVDLIKFRESLKKELLEYDDPNEILDYVADELKKSLCSIQEKQSGHHPPKERVTRGLLTPRSKLKVVLIEVLKSNGGRAHIQDVQYQMAAKLKGKFTKEDLESLEDGVLRWEKNVQWLRYKLVQDGVLKKNSPRGYWELEDY